MGDARGALKRLRARCGQRRFIFCQRRSTGRARKVTGVKAVIVGAGASGALHALALRAAGVEIAAVYDPDRERAEAVTGACGGRVVGTIVEAACVDAEVAAICSPPAAHVEQAQVMAGGGRLVFVEKPVATSRRELERIAEVPGCVPVLQWRAGRALRAIRRAVLAGELGPTPVASIDLSWARDAAYFEARHGWGAGAVLSIGIHALDAVSWALGRDIVAAASALATREGADRETAAVAALRFRRGAIASFRITLDGAADSTTITVCGAGRTVTLRGGEADPTGSTLSWGVSDRDERERLEARERETRGALGSPLLVPYVGAAIRAWRTGARVGAHEDLPSISSTFAAHGAALVIAQAEEEPIDARPFRCETSACAAASRAMVTRNGEHET